MRLDASHHNLAVSSSSPVNEDPDNDEAEKDEEINRREPGECEGCFGEPARTQSGSQCLQLPWQSICSLLACFRATFKLLSVGRQRSRSS